MIIVTVVATFTVVLFSLIAAAGVVLASTCLISRKFGFVDVHDTSATRDGLEGGPSDSAVLWAVLVDILF